jgi:hypothetical protein
VFTIGLLYCFHLLLMWKNVYLLALSTIFSINKHLYYCKKNSVCKQTFNSRSFPDLKFELRIRLLQIIPEPTRSGADTLRERI